MIKLLEAEKKLVFSFLKGSLGRISQHSTHIQTVTLKDATLLYYIQKYKYS